MRRLVLVILLAAFAYGCSSPTDPNSDRRTFEPRRGVDNECVEEAP